ncbi:hypothetical protein [Vibrio natriegens]|uniref:hypothetical protein n=1 Tax=Vibrio natriegens TaxID=691 RepID=UPI0008041AC8|nr:hypothetical protein [Vibrio natriegens]ANQ16280.1 hypothetical protein BA891_03125 [Vibrio natriegens]
MLDNYESKLNPEYSYVSSPDHPNLISSPDALIAKKGELIAYYRVHSDERARAKNLLSRLAISRLALPTHTKHILVLFPRDSEKILSNFAEHFDRVIEESDLLNSFNLLNDKSREDIFDRNNFCRDAHYIRFGIVYDLSAQQEASSHERERTFSINTDLVDSVYYSDWFKRSRNREVRKEFFKSQLFFKTRGGVVSVPDFEHSSNKIERLRSICLSSLQIESNFENGALESDPLLGKFILSDSVPSYKHDVLKGLRSASFCGLSLSGATSIRSINNYADFLADKIDGGIREFRKKKNRHIKRNSNW